MGIDWIAIIGTLLLPMLANCFKKTSSEDPQAVLKSHYNAATGSMDSDIVRECMPSTRRAARQARRNADRSDRKNFPRLSEDQIYGITEDNLIKAKNANATEVAAVMSAADSIGDDD